MIHPPDRNGRARVGKMPEGFTATGKGVTREFVHASGWFVQHCGHPTANTPWAVYDPAGDIHTDGIECHLGGAFRHVRDAWDHVLRHVADGTTGVKPRLYPQLKGFIHG